MVPTGAAGPGCMVLLSGEFRGTASPFMPHRWLFTRPVLARTTPSCYINNLPFLHFHFNPTHKLAAQKIICHSIQCPPPKERFFFKIKLSEDED